MTITLDMTQAITVLHGNDQIYFIRLYKLEEPSYREFKLEGIRIVSKDIE